MSIYLGIDIGGTKIAGALASGTGEVIRHARTPTDAALGGAHVLEAALGLAAQLIEQSPETIAGIGIGAGGQIDSKRGVVLSATDILPGWSGMQVGAAFRERFGVAACVDNDVNALASGELAFGAARGVASAAFLALGTGVGGALVLNGRIHHGAHWCAGEIGHILIDTSADARPAADGALGTLEAYCSGPGLLQTYDHLRGGDPPLSSAEQVGAAALRDPHGSAAEAVRKTGIWLGYGLVSVASILDPDLIVIGGGLASLGLLLLDPARETLRMHALPGLAQCKVRTAALGEHAAAIGAATLAMPGLHSFEGAPL